MITAQNHDGVLVVRPRGRVDGFSAPGFERDVKAALGGSGGPVVMDCENLSHLSSAGLRAILTIARALRRRNLQLSLCSVSAPVAELLHVSGFDRVVPTHRSLEAALAAAAGPAAEPHRAGADSG